jgi:hypothetical protein
VDEKVRSGNLSAPDRLFSRNIFRVRKKENRKHLFKKRKQRLKSAIIAARQFRRKPFDAVIAVLM